MTVVASVAHVSRGFLSNVVQAGEAYGLFRAHEGHLQGSIGHAHQATSCFVSNFGD